METLERRFRARICGSLESFNALDFRYVFVLDCGSILSSEEGINIGLEFAYWASDNTAGRWGWFKGPEPVSDTNQDPVDVRWTMWIGFDSSQDAVLARITWLDLRSAGHVDYRGLLGEAE